MAKLWSVHTGEVNAKALTEYLLSFLNNRHISHGFIYVWVRTTKYLN